MHLWRLHSCYGTQNIESPFLMGGSHEDTLLRGFLHREVSVPQPAKQWSESCTCGYGREPALYYQAWERGMWTGGSHPLPPLPRMERPTLSYGPISNIFSIKLFPQHKHPQIRDILRLHFCHSQQNRLQKFKNCVKKFLVVVFFSMVEFEGWNSAHIYIGDRT